MPPYRTYRFATIQTLDEISPRGVEILPRRSASSFFRTPTDDVITRSATAQYVPQRLKGDRFSHVPDWRHRARISRARSRSS